MVFLRISACRNWDNRTSLAPPLDLPQGNPIDFGVTLRVLSYKHLIGALPCGFALRLFFITHFPFYSGDTSYYEELARNWLYHGVYGFYLRGQLFSADIRMPGYPAFLATIYATVDRTRMSVMGAQIAVDLCTCVLTALLAAQLVPASKKKKVAAIALWIAALCPFMANYSAAVLTETLATFFTVLAMFVFVKVLNKRYAEFPRRSFDDRALLVFAAWFFLLGLITGMGTLVRPETPLLLIAAGAILCLCWRRPSEWWKVTLALPWMAAGLLVGLAPWAIRNANNMGRAEFLAPEYAAAKGDFVPEGFFDWTRTWMVKFGDAYRVTWKLSTAPILVEDLPPSAFDSEVERAKVASLLSQYNAGWNMTPLLDYQFGQLARERRARQPVRTYLFIPVERAFMIWFTPRIELLPYTGNLWPPGDAWHNNSTDFSVTAGLGALNILLVVVALAGVWRARTHAGVVFLAVFLVFRTAFLTQLHTVEPRYVIECMPAMYALAALAFIRRRRRTQRENQTAVAPAGLAPNK
jgi:4-amino-4-deoxy-L-arabinose transferase-like glycosyltransferase